MDFITAKQNFAGTFLGVVQFCHQHLSSYLAIPQNLFKIFPCEGPWTDIDHFYFYSDRVTYFDHAKVQLMDNHNNDWSLVTLSRDSDSRRFWHYFEHCSVVCNMCVWAFLYIAILVTQSGLSLILKYWELIFSVL